MMDLDASHLERTDTSTPMARAADYVFSLQQPDGATRRVCLGDLVQVPDGPACLVYGLELLARYGLIAYGGGGWRKPANVTDGDRRPLEFWWAVDHGGEFDIRAAEPFGVELPTDDGQEGGEV